jgi:signal transduction histidine kinase
MSAHNNGNTPYWESERQSIMKMLQPSRVAKTWWRKSAVGYPCAILLVAVGVGLTLLGEFLLPRFYFPSVLLLVAILLTSLFWGVGPGLLALALSCAALAYFYLAPFGDLSLTPLNWELLFQMLPFVLAGLVVAILTSQREAARLQALQAMQLAREQARRLSDLNEDLQQANRLKDFFLSVASHELKTPITTIRGQAQLALRRLAKRKASFPEAEGLREVFTSVEEQTKRVTNLLNDLLDISALRSGKLAIERNPCNFNEICARAVEEQGTQSGRPIELLLPTPAIHLQGDARRLGQVVTNLVNNALKYSSPEAPVRVKVACEPHTVRLSVQDAGKGIPPEQLANIFKPFYRTSEARASSATGTGLGLAICKHIVEQHRGRIWCESVVGVGSTFFVELPVDDEAEDTTVRGNLDASV